MSKKVSKKFIFIVQVEIDREDCVVNIDDRDQSVDALRVSHAVDLDFGHSSLLIDHHCITRMESVKLLKICETAWPEFDHFVIMIYTGM